MTRAASRGSGTGAARPRHDAVGSRPGGHVGAWLKETVVIIASALVLSMLIKTFLVQSFFIPSGSMQNTLQIDDRVLVSKLVPGPFDLHRGDIVVFRDPGGWLPETAATDQSLLVEIFTFVGLLPQDSGEHLIKRLIGLPGDTVACCDADGRVSVNGVSIDEPYIADGSIPSEMEFSVVVPEGHLWVMGDNRQDSRDSRYNQDNADGGSIPLDDVVGVAFVTLWPADRWTFLENPGETFAGVP